MRAQLARWLLHFTNSTSSFRVMNLTVHGLPTRFASLPIPSCIASRGFLWLKRIGKRHFPASKRFIPLWPNSMKLLPHTNTFARKSISPRRSYLVENRATLPTSRWLINRPMRNSAFIGTVPTLDLLYPAVSHVLSLAFWHFSPGLFFYLAGGETGVAEIGMVRVTRPPA